MNSDLSANFNVVDGIPVIVLSTSSPAVAYKEAILLRRRHNDSANPIPESVWVGLLNEKSQRDFLGKELVHALELAHFKVLGFVGDSLPIKMLAKSAGLELLLAHVSNKDSLLVEFLNEPEDIESWAKPGLVNKSLDSVTTCAPCLSRVYEHARASSLRSAAVMSKQDFLPTVDQEVARVSDALNSHARATISDLENRVPEDQSAVLENISTTAPKYDEFKLPPAAIPGNATVRENATVVSSAAPVSKRVHTRIHSGQIVEAEADIVLLGPVGCGAEIMAGGSIHAYGPLYGKVFAGNFGDESARIYASNFRPEMVSIAGCFKLFEEVPEALLGKAVEIWLEDGVLRFACIEEYS